MLGRVRRRQYDDDPSLDQRRPALTTRTAELFNALMVQADRARFESDDFDITDNTILDSQMLPYHFDQVTHAILMQTTQLPSILKADFSWNWQCTTLTRGDELVNLPLACLQPHRIYIPDYVTTDGRRSNHGRYVFGVLSMYHSTKTSKAGQKEPNYNFVLPHRNPLRCSIGSLALLCWYIFYHQRLLNVHSEWDWSRASTWRQVCAPEFWLYVTKTLIMFPHRFACSSGLKSARTAAARPCEQCSRHFLTTRPSRHQRRHIWHGKSCRLLWRQWGKLPLLCDSCNFSLSLPLF